MEFDFPDQKKRNIWVHVYRNDVITDTQNEAFYGAMEKFKNDWKEAYIGDVNLLKSPPDKVLQNCQWLFADS